MKRDTNIVSLNSAFPMYIASPPSTTASEAHGTDRGRSISSLPPLTITPNFQNGTAGKSSPLPANGPATPTAVPNMDTSPIRPSVDITSYSRAYTPDYKFDAEWEASSLRYDRDGTILRSLKPPPLSQTRRATNPVKRWPILTRYIVISVLILVLMALSVVAIVLGARHYHEQPESASTTQAPQNQ
ncbi:hypothetical protein EXIGLDRAFT_765415 [Exidia glandulosa HHB12029]|uniref:Uncharacterized protein n=1 Tax=Exidia glandulosa HHB12029 TaxID=1314781 RepID=A0A165KGU1_EXIGL|nr:hypothetical protein EXIGLDRAFT_765415 [Exidia glandulosa HHB12029]